MVPREEALRAWPVPALPLTSKSPTNGNAAYMHKLEKITTRFDYSVCFALFLIIVKVTSEIFEERLVKSVHSKRSCRKQSKIA